MTTPRPALAGLLAAAALLSACGGEREEVPGAGTTRLNVPGEAAGEVGPNSSVGLLVSVDQSSLVLKSTKGFETFTIRDEDRRSLGLDHLTSHAGSDVGFQVSFEPDPADAEIRYAVAAQEVAPPEGVTLAPPARPESKDEQSAPTS